MSYRIRKLRFGHVVGIAAGAVIPNTVATSRVHIPVKQAAGAIVGRRRKFVKVADDPQRVALVGCFVCFLIRGDTSPRRDIVLKCGPVRCVFV